MVTFIDFDKGQTTISIIIYIGLVFLYWKKFKKNYFISFLMIMSLINFGDSCQRLFYITFYPD